MDAVKIGHTTNASVYIRDQQLIGRFDDFTAPEVEYGTVKHESLGSVGEVELPGRSLKALKGKGTFGFIDADLVPEFYDPRAGVPLMIEGYTDVFDGNGLNIGAGYRIITHITLSVFKDGGKAFKIGDPFKGEFEYTATRLVQRFSNSATIFREIDLINQINRLNGVDVWSRY